MLSLLIAVALAQTSDQKAPTPEAGNIASLLSGDDYPAEAQKSNFEGEVILDLTITKEGRVRDCRVKQSSGYPILDDKTCAIMIERARFTPARNSLGEPVEDVYRTPKIRWALSN